MVIQAQTVICGVTICESRTSLCSVVLVILSNIPNIILVSSRNPKTIRNAGNTYALFAAQSRYTQSAVGHTSSSCARSVRQAQQAQPSHAAFSPAAAGNGEHYAAAAPAAASPAAAVGALATCASSK